MNKRALAEGEKAAKQAIYHILVLSSIKFLAGIVTGMTVVLAGAISSFADTLGLFASYLGLKLSRKSANKKFKYGYYKIETFAALVISIGILILGGVIMKKGIESLFLPQEGYFRSFAITASVLAIMHSLKIGKKLDLAAKKTNSLSLKANARDKKMDVIAEVGVVISIIANYRGIPYIEGIVTMIIAIIILKEGVFSSKESLFFLLDYWDDPRLIRKIRKVFRKEKDLILEVKRLRLRRAGTFIFGEAFIEINPFAGVVDLREELNLLQKKILALNPYIKDFAIYTHITKSEKVKLAIPIIRGKTLRASVAANIRETKAYLFVSIKNSKIKDFYVKKLDTKHKKPDLLADFLVNEDVNILIDNKLNSLTYFNLRRFHHIQIYPNFSDIKTAKDTIQLLLIDT